MATSKIPNLNNIKDIIKRSAESESASWTAGTAARVDISIPEVTGYEFLTCLNPRPNSNYGPLWITTNGPTTCRVWTIPTTTKTNTVSVDILYIKR